MKNKKLILKVYKSVTAGIISMMEKGEEKIARDLEKAGEKEMKRLLELEEVLERVDKIRASGGE